MERALRPTLVLFANIVFLFSFSQIAMASSGITYHGKIIKPDGVTPVTSSTTQFRIQVRTPGGENCLLWEEQQTKDLSSSGGVFTLTINDTSEPTLIPNTLPFAIERVFSNRTAFTGLTGCNAGNSYTPSTAVDGRNLQVYFRENPSDAWEQMPLTKINFVPFALNSVQLEGYRASEFLKIDSASSYTPLTATQVNTLMDIIAGTNTQYLRPSSTFAGDVSGTYSATSVDKIKGVSVSTTAPTNGQVLKYNGTTWAPAADNTGSTVSDASYTVKGIVQINTDLATSGLFISSGVLALPNVITAGGPTGGASTVPVITYDQKGRLTAVSTATVDDTTKLPLAGGTMTGNINMGTKDITNATNVSSTNVSATNASVRNLILNDNDTNTVTIKTPTDVAANYALTLPGDDGTSGQVLSTDGSGVLSWVSPNSSLGLTANKAVIANGTGTALTAFSCSINQVFSFDASGNPICADVTPAGGFLNGGNSFGANATLGTNDNYALNLETNNSTRMTILNNGNVGIGSTSPGSLLEVAGTMNARHVITDISDTRTYNTTSATTAYPYGSYMEVRQTSATDTTTAELVLNTRNGAGDFQAAYLGAVSSGTSYTPSIVIGQQTAASGYAERVRIDTSGNVGIGTNSPNTILDVNGAISQRGMAAPAVSAAGQGRIYFDSTSNTFKISQNGGGYTDLVGGGGDFKSDGSVAMTGTLKATDGTAALPAYTFSADTNTGIYRVGADTLGFSTNGTKVATFDSNGVFHLYGSGGGIHSEGGGQFFVNSTDLVADIGFTAYGNRFYGPYANVVPVTIQGAATQTAHLFDIKDSTGTILNSVDSSGQTGLGVAAPTSKLDLNGAFTQRGMAAPSLSAAGQGRIYFDSTSNKFRVSENGGAYADLVTSVSSSGGFVDGGNSFGQTGDLGTNDNYALNLRTNNATRVTIDTSGNVGIGTTSPSYPLTVSGDTIGVGSGIMKIASNNSINIGISNTVGYNNSIAVGRSNSTNGGDAAVLVGVGNAANPANADGAVGFGRNNTAEAASVVLGIGNISTNAADSVTVGIGITNTTANSLQMGPSDAAKVTILSSGNFGIGTAAPATALDVNGAISTRGMAAPSVSTAGNGRIYFDSTANKFKISQNGGAYVDLVSAGGSVSGLTTGYIPKATSATALGDSNVQATATGLKVQNTVSGSSAFEVATDSGGKSAYLTFTSSGVQHAQIGGYDGELQMDTVMNGPLVFKTNNTERMRVLGTGNIGIGTTTPNANLNIKTATNTTALTVTNAADANIFSLSNHWDRANMQLYDASGTERVGFYIDPNDGPISHFDGSATNFADAKGNTFGSAVLAQVPYVLNQENGLIFTNSQNATDPAMGAVTAYTTDVVNHGYGGLHFKTSAGTLTTRMTVDPTGNVGIGTTSPNTALDIAGAQSLRGMAAPSVSPAGQGRIYFDSTSNKFKVSQNGGAYTDLVSSSSGTVSGTTGKIAKFTGASTVGDSLISDDGTNLVTINPSGANYNTKLKLVNGGNLNSFIMGLSSSGTTLTAMGDGTATYGDMTFQADDGAYGTTRMTIKGATGNVGIGTTSPGAKLEVNGNLKIANTITSASTETVIENTGDTLGTTRLRLRNRTGFNGAMFENAALDLVDFGFATSSGAQNTVRFEHRGGAYVANTSNATGEFQFLDGVNSGTITAPLVVGSAAVIVGASGISSTSGSSAKLGVGTNTPGTAFDVNGAVSVRGMAAPSVSPAGQGRIYFDSTSNTFKISQNGGAYSDIATNASTGFLTTSAYNADLTPAASCTTSQTPYWSTVADTWACQNINVTTAGGFFKDGGNALGAASSIGTTDNFNFSIKTNNSTAVTVTNGGYVGIGTTNPAGILDVQGGTAAASTAGSPINIVSQAAGAGTGNNGGDINITTGAGAGGWQYGNVWINLGSTNPGSLYVSKHASSGYTTTSNAENVPPFQAQFANGWSVDNNTAITAYEVRNASSNYQLGYFGTLSVTGAGAHSPAFVWGQSTGTGAYAERMRMDPSGNVGIGTTSPNDKLEVNGTIRNSASYNNGTSTTIDWSRSNTQYTASGCTGTQFTFSNMRDGGVYTLVITGTFSANCVFGQTSPDTLSGTPGSGDFYFLPANGTAGGSNAIFSFMRVGNKVYVTWNSGFAN